MPKEFHDRVALTCWCWRRRCRLRRGPPTKPMTKTQGDAILDELSQIKKLLERQPAAPTAAGPRADERVKSAWAARALDRTARLADLMVLFIPTTSAVCQRFPCRYSRAEENYSTPAKIRYVNAIFRLPLASTP